MLSMLKSAIQGNVISVRQEKTGKQLWIPIHRDLKPIIDAALKASPQTCLTILTNTAGRPVDGRRLQVIVGKISRRASWVRGSCFTVSGNLQW